ncbi:toprim domain-containing protein [uncultured Cocleimonas sp.]|uniref:toprim domain-containing protein n=1 Tax=uncultured Cocleimonas sp. TaxID=1051587 RepID=UPI00260D5285|nr:toprim domain-containing protein [uncultured Cocleimonas sp.]
MTYIKKPAFSAGNTERAYKKTIESSHVNSNTTNLYDAISAFQLVLEDNELGYLNDIKVDAGIQRFKLDSDKGNAKSGWYVFYSNAVVFAGAYGNWKTGLNESWHFKRNNKPLLIKERSALKKIRDDMSKYQQAEKEKRYVKARRIANSVWESSLPASPNHPYLLKKHCMDAAKSLREQKGNLLVPLYNQKQLVSIQYINKHGKKFFAKGSQLKGSYFMFGNIKQPFDVVYICEGVSTGWTVYILSGFSPVFCAMNAGNLTAVSLSVRKCWPDIKIVICADNDVKENKDVPNIGVEEATKAALAVNGRVSTPNMPHGGKCDFNDLYILAIESEKKSIGGGSDEN